MKSINLRTISKLVLLQCHIIPVYINFWVVNILAGGGGGGDPRALPPLYKTLFFLNIITCHNIPCFVQIMSLISVRFSSSFCMEEAYVSIHVYDKLTGPCSHCVFVLLIVTTKTLNNPILGGHQSQQLYKKLIFAYSMFHSLGSMCSSLSCSIIC